MWIVSFSVDVRVFFSPLHAFLLTCFQAVEMVVWWWSDMTRQAYLHLRSPVPWSRWIQARLRLMLIFLGLSYLTQYTHTHPQSISLCDQQSSQSSECTYYPSLFCYLSLRSILVIFCHYCSLVNRQTCRPLASGSINVSSLLSVCHLFVFWRF